MNYHVLSQSLHLSPEAWTNNKFFFIKVILHANVHFIKERQNLSMPIKCNVMYCNTIKPRLTHINNCVKLNCNLYLCNLVKSVIQHANKCINANCILCTKVRNNLPTHLLKFLYKNPIIKEKLKLKNVKY